MQAIKKKIHNYYNRLYMNLKTKKTRTKAYWPKLQCLNNKFTEEIDTVMTP